MWMWRIGRVSKSVLNSREPMYEKDLAWADDNIILKWCSCSKLMVFVARKSFRGTSSHGKSTIVRVLTCTLKAQTVNGSYDIYHILLKSQLWGVFRPRSGDSCRGSVTLSVSSYTRVSCYDLWRMADLITQTAVLSNLRGASYSNGQN